MPNIEELRALLAKAMTQAPLPWKWEKSDNEPGCFDALRAADDRNVLPTTVGYGNIHALYEDAALLVAAVNALPALLDVAEAAQRAAAGHVVGIPYTGVAVPCRCEMCNALAKLMVPNVHDT